MKTFTESMGEGEDIKYLGNGLAQHRDSLTPTHATHPSFHDHEHLRPLSHVAYSPHYFDLITSLSGHKKTELWDNAIDHIVKAKEHPWYGEYLGDILKNYTKYSKDLNRSAVDFPNNSFRGENTDRGTLENFLAESKLSHPLTVFSALRRHVVDRLKNRDFDETFKNPAWMSASTDLHVAREHAGVDSPSQNQTETHVAMIQLPKGAQALYISPVAEFSHENEVLINRGSKFKYHGHSYYEAPQIKGGPQKVLTHYVHALEYVGNHND